MDLAYISYSVQIPNNIGDKRKEFKIMPKLFNVWKWGWYFP